MLDSLRLSIPHFDEPSARCVFAAAAGDCTSQRCSFAARLDLDGEERPSRSGGEGVGLKLYADVPAIVPEQSERAGERRGLPA